MKPEASREKPTPTLNHFQPPFTTNNSVPQPNQQLSNISALQDASSLQQLVQLPISQAAAVPEMKPPVSVVNNTITAVSKNVIPHAAAAQAPIVQAKAELPQISPTGNNNKSNINNLNHFNAQQQQQQHQHLSMSSSNAQSLLNMPNQSAQGQVVNMMPSVPQQAAMLSAGSTNLNQMKQHPSQFGTNLCMDSVEHSLASLEQPLLSQKQDLSMLMDMQNSKMMMNQIMGANGFGDFNSANLMNMLGMPPIDPQAQNPFTNLNAQMKQNRQFTDPQWPPQNNPMIKPNTSQPNVQMNHPQQHPMQMQPPLPQQVQLQQQQPPPLPSPKSANKEKIMLTPKPIEELLINPNDKSKSMSSSSSYGSSYNKAEQNLKNASSWSQLGQGSPQSMSLATPPAQKSKLPVDAFQEYKTKAKEQAQRHKQEQEKMKKQKEQEIKRQQESMMIHKQKTTEDLSNGHK